MMAQDQVPGRRFPQFLWLKNDFVFIPKTGFRPSARYSSGGLLFS